MSTKTETANATKEASQEELDKNLTPQELYDGLDSLIADIDSIPADLVIPEGTEIGGKDFGGQTMAQLLTSIRDGVITPEGTVVYEPLLDDPQDQPSSGTLDNKKQLPEWMQDEDHPELAKLMWEKPSINPLWLVTETPYSTPEGKSRVRINYQRRGQIIKPGESSDFRSEERHQSSIESDFPLVEMQVIRKVLSQYENIENILDGEEGKAQEEAKELFESVVREENAFRHGELDHEPEILKNSVEAAIETLKKSQRGFNLGELSGEQITQDVANILSQLVVLNRQKQDGHERVPKPKSWIKEIPTFKRDLAKFALLVSKQLGLKEDDPRAQGLMVLLGEAGTGKNEMAEDFCAKTNRPFYLFSCGKGMRSVDLVQHYEFDTKEGTQKFLTDLSQGIQTPGAMVLIDEANALKPEVQAILHSLGDGNRSLSYDGIKIPVAEGVIIVIAGNPSTYASAGEFGQALLNRGVGLSMVKEYPSYTKADWAQKVEGLTDAEKADRIAADNSLGEKIMCDEVLALYPEIKIFNDISDDDFALMWESIVNQDPVATSQYQTSEHLKIYRDSPEVIRSVESKLLGLKRILKVIDAWRKYYENQNGEFDLIAPSMRDSIAVARAYEETGDVDKAFLQCYDIFRKNPRKGMDETYLSLQKLLTKTI